MGEYCTRGSQNVYKNKNAVGNFKKILKNP